jgi:hypothetical protein
MRASEGRRHKSILAVSIVALGSVVATALIASSAAARAGLHRQLTALGVPNVAITAAVDVPAAGPTRSFAMSQGR